MIAALVALTLGSVLDARALHKSAVTQPAGVTRDIAMAATPTPTAPAKLVYSAQKKMTIYTGGDAFMSGMPAGEPQMADPEINAKQLKLNEIYKSEAEKRLGRVAYLDIYELFSPGGAVITGEMLKLLSNHFDLQGALPASLSLTQ